MASSRHPLWLQRMNQKMVTLLIWCDLSTHYDNYVMFSFGCLCYHGITAVNKVNFKKWRFSVEKKVFSATSQRAKVRVQLKYKLGLKLSALAQEIEQLLYQAEGQWFNPCLLVSMHWSVPGQETEAPMHLSGGEFVIVRICLIHRVRKKIYVNRWMCLIVNQYSYRVKCTMSIYHWFLSFRPWQMTFVHHPMFVIWRSSDEPHQVTQSGALLPQNSKVPDNLRISVEMSFINLTTSVERWDDIQNYKLSASLYLWQYDKCLCCCLFVFFPKHRIEKQIKKICNSALAIPCIKKNTYDTPCCCFR